MAESEEEEGVGCSRDHTTKKKAHRYHPYMILCPWRSVRVVHNPLRVAYIAGWDQPCVVSRPWSPQTGCLILIRSSQRLRHYRCPQVIRSTRRYCFHSQIRIKIQVGWRIVSISLPQPAIICLLKIKKKSSYSIQENNNLQNKMVERTYHEWLSTVVNELLHSFLTIFTPHMRLHRQLHWAQLTSIRCSLQEKKMLQVKYIYK